ncbi:hypothetical protein HAX54_023359, partial [Datura stramonium]|nr:hypothetical protein [Datura stramonium]
RRARIPTQKAQIAESTKAANQQGQETQKTVKTTQIEKSMGETNQTVTRAPNEGNVDTTQDICQWTEVTQSSS